MCIRLYQLLGRGFFRRECLYAPSCSCLALAFFRKGPFLVAWRSTRHQLARCNGDYALRLNRLGEVEMLTGTGEVVPEAELSPQVVAKLKWCIRKGRKAGAEPSSTTDGLA